MANDKPAEVSDDLVELIRPAKPRKPGMDIISEPTTEVTVEQLRRAAETNLSHPLAAGFLAAIDGQEDSRKLAVEKADLQGLLEDRDVHRQSAVIDGRRVFKKVLGPARKPLLQTEAERQPLPEPEPEPLRVEDVPAAIDDDEDDSEGDGGDVSPFVGPH